MLEIQDEEIKRALDLGYKIENLGYYFYSESQAKHYRNLNKRITEVYSNSNSSNFCYKNLCNIVGKRVSRIYTECLCVVSPSSGIYKEKDLAIKAHKDRYPDSEFIGIGIYVRMEGIW